MGNNAYFDEAEVSKFTMCFFCKSANIVAEGQAGACANRFGIIIDARNQTKPALVLAQDFDKTYAAAGIMLQQLRQPGLRGPRKSTFGNDVAALVRRIENRGIASNPHFSASLVKPNFAANPMSNSASIIRTT